MHSDQNDSPPAPPGELNRRVFLQGAAAGAAALAVGNRAAFALQDLRGFLSDAVASLAILPPSRQLPRLGDIGIYLLKPQRNPNPAVQLMEKAIADHLLS